MSDSEFDFDADESLAYAPRPSRRASEALPTLLAPQAKVLELVTHLTAYSDLLVVVSGEEGSGKTLLAKSLHEAHREQDESLYIGASVMLGLSSILRQLAQHWQMDDVPNDQGELREAVRLEALSRHEMGSSMLVIIDDAEQLDGDTLNEIAHFALVVRQAVSFILFGLPGLEQQFRGGPAQAPLHKQAIEPLSQAEIVHILHSRYGEAMPLDKASLKQIYQQSRGFPGVALRLAEDALDPVVTMPASPISHEHNRFPLTHILAISVVVMVIAISFLYRDRLVEEADESAVDVALDVAPVVPVETTDVLSHLPLTQTPEPQAQELALEEKVSASEEMDYNYAAPVHTLPAQVEPASVPSVPSTAPVANTAPAPSIAPAPVKPVAPTPVQAPSQIASVQKAATPPAPAPVASVKQPSDDRQALLAVKSGFVVQLFGSYERINAEKFRSQWQQGIRGKLYLYETQHNNRAWFVIVSGIYPTRAEAASAVSAMPEPLRKQSPWIRDISGVQGLLKAR